MAEQIRYDHYLHGGDYNPELWLVRPDFLKKDIDYFKQKRRFDIDPVSAGEFNIRFAKMNNGNDISKVYA